MPNTTHYATTGRHAQVRAFHMRAGTPRDIGAGAQISNGMRSVIVSLAVMVSFMFPRFKSGIF